MKNRPVRWIAGNTQGVHNAYWAAMVTNYIKRNRHRIPNGPGWIKAWAKIRLEAHIKYNLSLSRTPTGQQAIHEEAIKRCFRERLEELQVIQRWEQRQREASAFASAYEEWPWN